MSYKFYKNKKAFFHPDIEIESTEKIWKNMILTSSPTGKKKKYIKLKQSPNGDKSKQSYVQKQIRIDKMGLVVII